MRIQLSNILVLLIFVLPCFSFARKLPPAVERAMSKGAEAKICLKVCDDEGSPVSNASVRAEFDLLPNPHSVYGKTDSNGVVVVKGKTNGNRIIGFLMDASGHWSLAPFYDFTYSEGPNGWQTLSVAGAGENPTEADLERLRSEVGL